MFMTTQSVNYCHNAIIEQQECIAVMYLAKQLHTTGSSLITPVNYGYIFP